MQWEHVRAGARRRRKCFGRGKSCGANNTNANLANCEKGAGGKEKLTRLPGSGTNAKNRYQEKKGTPKPPGLIYANNQRKEGRRKRGRKGHRKSKG